MSESVKSRAGLAGGACDPRDKVRERCAAGDAFLRRCGQSAAAILLVVFGAAIIFLIKGSMPAIRAFGLGFFTTPA